MKQALRTTLGAAGSKAQRRGGVDPLSVAQQFEMQVGATRGAGAPDPAESLAQRHRGAPAG